MLAYAAIMLNTDAHNSMVRWKMSLKEFVTNVQYNDGGELIPQVSKSINFHSLTSHPNAEFHFTFFFSSQAFLEDMYPRIVEEEIKMEDDGALFPTASRKGWLNVRSKSPFAVWKRRWLVLTHDKLHICRKIGVSAVLPLKTILSCQLF